MSDCTDVKKNIARKTGNRKKLWRLVLLTEWHFKCLKEILEKSRANFPTTQEKILFDAIMAEVKYLAPDLIQLDIKNFKFITIGLADYEVGNNVNFNMFLVESLLSSYISMSEEIPKIRTRDKNLRNKLNEWQPNIEALKKDNQIKLRLDSSTKAKIDRYLKTRRNANSLYTIYSKIESSTKIFEGTEISIEKKVLILQRIFHTAGEYLKDTERTPNLSSDVRQSLEKMGIPVKRLSKFRDILAHNQIFPSIEKDANQVKQFFDCFLIIKELIKSKIIEIEDSFIQTIIKESEMGEALVTELIQFTREQGVRGLAEGIDKIKPGNAWVREKRYMNEETKQLLDYVDQNVRQLKSTGFSKGSAEGTKRKLSKNELKRLNSIINHIGRSKLQIYDKLLVELKSWNFQTYISGLDTLHSDALKITQVIDILSYNDISWPHSILDKFLKLQILEKITVTNNEEKRSSTKKVEERSLKQELELYFDGKSFKNYDVYYADFEDSNPENLIEWLNNDISKPDDNTRKLITFLESKQSNIKNQDNDIPPEKYERLVKDLPTNSNRIKEKLFLYSVEWRKKKCVDLLEQNIPALKTIYDNIMEGKLIDVSVFIDLAGQYKVLPEPEKALETRAASLRENIKNFYLNRAIEEYIVLKTLKIPSTIQSQYMNGCSLLEKAYKAHNADKIDETKKYELHRMIQFRNKLAHGDPLISKESDIKKMEIKLVEANNKVDGPINLRTMISDMSNMHSYVGSKDTTKYICPTKFVRKRRYASESCLTWEEIDEFSEGGAENRDPDNIRIDSEKFISRILSEDLEANEEKFFNLIALASESDVIGDHTSKVNILTDHRMHLGRLERVGQISGIVMHGMIAKDLVGDLLRGDYKDFVKTLGILAIGTGLQTAAEVASMKGAGYIFKSRAVLGNTLRFASPFLSRGVTAFIAWDLYKQVKEYKKGDKDALIYIIGDSVQLGVDSIEIGVETGEVFGLLDGVSAFTGPIGMTIGALIFVGTDVYAAVRTVQKIDEYIHLTVWQKVAEGILAFLGQQPSEDIEQKIEEKDANNQAVKHVTCLLKDNPHIRRYVIPSIEVCTKELPNPKYIPENVTMWMPVNPNSYLPVFLEPPTMTRTFTTKILDNVVLLDEKKNDIKWSKTKPDNVEGFDLFCLPKGDTESVPEGGTYYCDGAIGVEYTDNRTGNDTWLSLGDGEDTIKGFLGSSNIFVFGYGHKIMTGGNKDDNFIFEGKSDNTVSDSKIEGYINGYGGIDTIDVSGLTPHYEWIKGVRMYQVSADFRKGFLKDTSNVALNIHNINVFIGRKGGVDEVVYACDTKHVDGRGGENKNYLDSIIIPKDDACSYDTKVTVNPYTKVTNNATRGNFHYIVKGEKGKEAYIELGSSSRSNNTFVFDYTLTDVAAIDKSEENINFSFVEEFYKREKKIDANSSFNLTVSGADKNTTTYQLIDGTKLVIGRNNVYAIQKTEKPIVCLVKDYSSIADKSQMYVVVHSNDEILVTGHDHGDVLMNDPNAKASHLVGGGGENVFVISSGHEKLTLANLPISDVVIYDFDQGDKIDTLDLHKIKEQLKKDIDREINTDVSKIGCDLLINLSLDDASKKEVVKITLKGALNSNRYKRVHIHIDNMYVIKEILGDFELTPQPLIFNDNSKTIYVINPTNVEKGGKIRVNKDIGDYIFARDNDALIIINPLISSTDENNLFTIMLNDFYYGNNQDKMQSLKIEFDDKTILLRREIERINSAENFSELTRKVRINSYKDVIYGIKKQKLFEAIERNNIDEVKELIEHGVNIDTRNNDGQTPLHIAALNGNVEVVKYLVEEKHADVNVKDNYAITPLQYAASSSSLNVVKYLVEEKHADVNVKDNYEITPLHYAALGGNLEVVKYLVEEKHADVNVKDNYEITPLHYAASSSSLNVVKYLVEEKNADVNVKGNSEMTPLHYAALGGNLEVVKYLVEEKNADVNVKDNSEMTPLHYAAFSSSLNVVKYLVEEKHADVNVKDDSATTPLHYAASRSSLNVVKYLVEDKHADVYVKNHFRITPLHYAAFGGNLEVVKYIAEEKHADINVEDDSQGTPLHHAAFGSTSANVYGRRSLGWTLLRYAGYDGNLEVVKYLVEEKHANVNVKDNSEYTPLHKAASSNNLNVVKYLVAEKHAGVNVKDYIGRTPLHLAVLDGNLEIVKYLVGKGADFNLEDHLGWTALHEAGRNGTLEMIKYFLGNGADVNLKNNFGVTPLLKAADGGNQEMVKYLIEKGARIDIKFNGVTALNILEDKGYKHVVDSIVEKLSERLFDAVQHDDLGEVQDLLNQGVSVNVQDGNGATLLHFASRNGKIKVLKYLMEQIYARVNRIEARVKDYVAVTPLQVAVTNANLDVAKYLVGIGADVDLKNVFRWITASNGSLGMIKYLMHMEDVDLNVRTRFNRQTPLALAVAGNYSNIVEHLERKVNVKRETPQQHERSHHHSSRRLLTTDLSNQPEIATSNASEKSSWINYLVGSIVKLEESSAPSEIASSNHPIRQERQKRHNDHSRHEDGMRMRMHRVSHRHRRVQKRNVKYQDSHYYTDQLDIAASSGTRPSSWINGLVDWIKEKGGGLVSSVADKFAAKEWEDPKSTGIHACSVRLEKMYSATIPNIPQSRKSQGVPKGNIHNTSWSGWSANREKVTSNVTDAPEMNTIVLNNALILGDLAVRLVNGTRHKQPIHENLLSPREKSMRFIDENMIMRTIQQGKEKFGGLVTNMDEE